MGRFNPTSYDPRTESTTGHQVAGVLVVLAAPGNCRCGCGEPVAGKNSLFRMGHDARLKGKLIRAHLAGVKVVSGDPAVPEDERTALQVAEDYDRGDQKIWTTALTAAESKQGPDVRKRLQAANRAVLTRATGPQLGERRLVKVGRWEYTGQVAALYEIDGEMELEYVDRKGATKTVRQPLPAKGE